MSIQFLMNITVEEFDMYKPMMRPTSPSLRVKIYPNPRNRNNHEYFFKTILPTRESTLNGAGGNLDPYELADRLMEEKNKEDERQMYKELYEEAREKMKAFAEQAEAAEEEQAKKPAGGLPSFLGMVGNIVRSNPDLLKELNVPKAGLVTAILSGLVGDEPVKPEPVKAESAEPKTKVTFEPIIEEPDNPESGKTSAPPVKEEKTEQTPSPSPQHSPPASAADEENSQEEQLNAEVMRIMEMDVQVMEEVKAVFDTQKEKDKAMLAIRMFKDHPDLLMDALHKMIMLNASRMKEENRANTPPETEEPITVFIQTDLPPEPQQEPPGDNNNHEYTTESADLFFVEDQNY